MPLPAKNELLGWLGISSLQSHETNRIKMPTNLIKLMPWKLIQQLINSVHKLFTVLNLFIGPLVRNPLDYREI